MKEKNPNILVVDDEDMICNVLKNFLEDYGFTVKTASTGKEGQELIKKEVFDAVIVDMRLPDMFGDEFILEAYKNHPKTKYFVHTGSLNYSFPKELKDIGMNDNLILRKPMMDMTVIYKSIIEQIGKD